MKVLVDPASCITSIRREHKQRPRAAHESHYGMMNDAQIAHWASENYLSIMSELHMWRTNNFRAQRSCHAIQALVHTSLDLHHASKSIACMTRHLPHTIYVSLTARFNNKQHGTWGVFAYWSSNLLV